MKFTYEYFEEPTCADMDKVAKCFESESALF